MGHFSRLAQSYFLKKLTNCYTACKWEKEYSIAGTPVDLAGTCDEVLILIELEWRRADPADNSAKLFRHLSTGQIEFSNIIVIQVFTAYYDLAQGGVSSKRKNAEFVGQVAADAIDHLSYYSVDFDLEPPKRGQEWQDDWQSAAESTVNKVQEHIKRHI